MKKWEIVHVNRHVEKHREMENNPETWTKAQTAPSGLADDALPVYEQ